MRIYAYKLMERVYFQQVKSIDPTIVAPSWKDKRPQIHLYISMAMHFFVELLCF